MKILGLLLFASLHFCGAEFDSSKFSNLLSSILNQMNQPSKITAMVCWEQGKI